MSRVVLVLLAFAPFALAGCGGHAPYESCESCIPAADDVEAPASSTSMVVGLRPVADTYLYETDPTQGCGTAPLLWAGYNNPSGDGEMRSLIVFDLRVLPAGSVINKATLLLYASQCAPSEATVQCLIHRVTSRWEEMSATWNTHSTFFAPTPVATRNVSAANAGGMVRFNITPLVKNWVKNPARNFGCMVKGPAQFANGVALFGSRENEAPAFRPRLAVDYTPPA